MLVVVGCLALSLAFFCLVVISYYVMLSGNDNVTFPLLFSDYMSLCLNHLLQLLLKITLKSLTIAVSFHNVILAR